MNIWHEFIVRFLPFNSIEEYEGAKKIHISEMKVYWKQWQYILGLTLFLLPMLYFIYTVESWFLRFLLLLIVFGEMCIRDTITEHFCLKLFRQSNK